MDPKPIEPASSPANTPSGQIPAHSRRFFRPLIAAMVLIVGLSGVAAGLLWSRTRNPAVDSGMPAPQMTPTVSPQPALRMNPGPDWRTYADATTGMTLRYPPSVSLNTAAVPSGNSLLSVSVEALSSIPEELPLGMGRNAALSDKSSLEQGSAVNPGDFTASNDAIRVGGKYNGRVSMVLSRFEVCSVLFIRTLVFYPGEYRVTLTLSGDIKSIQQDMPSFFMVDPANCGGQTVWNRQTRESFLTALAEGKGTGRGQDWYDSFDGIVSSIVFSDSTKPEATPSGTASCESSDPSFCAIHTRIRTALEVKDYPTLISLQNPTQVTCISEGMFLAICEGQPDGAVKEGYTLGYYQSEGVIQDREKHLQSLTSYLSDRGPFSISPTRQTAGNKGTIVYLNADSTYLLIFRLRKTGGNWVIHSIIVGPTGLGTVHQTLPASIFMDE